MDIDMSIANDILKLLAANKINSQTTALNCKQLFEQCKSAGSAEDVSKNLSKLFKEGQLERIKPDDGAFRYWLANLNKLGGDKRFQASKGLTDSGKSLLIQKNDNHDIPAFLIKAADDLAVADSVDEKLCADITNKEYEKSPFVLLKNEIENNRLKNLKHQPFKVAVTSDGTLMIFGIFETFIELDHEQTEILSDFFNDLDLQGFVTTR